MSYYPVKERIEKIIDRHNSKFSKAEIHIIDALIKWLRGDHVDITLLYMFEQLIGFDPNRIPDEDKLVIMKLILTAHPDYLFKYDKPEDIARVFKSIPGFEDILKTIFT
ncbi:SIFV.gp64-like protein [Sulfolobus islandicus filamentous virus 2]|uniref:SIFV.gp64-like protein n=1 Tax=Sulfolobus islandicus filamentous virus 2 TaxID=1902331 RepID=A0A1D8BJC2_SIFV|nr:SIFV.gp64-like protein [Sulfolobus islandicus filamentous virus 2]